MLWEFLFWVKLYINHNINCHIHINGTAENHIYTIAIATTAPTLPSNQANIVASWKTYQKRIPIPNYPFPWWSMIIIISSSRNISSSSSAAFSICPAFSFARLTVQPSCSAKSKARNDDQLSWDSSAVIQLDTILYMDWLWLDHVTMRTLSTLKFLTCFIHEQLQK